MRTCNLANANTRDQSALDDRKLNDARWLMMFREIDEESVHFLTPSARVSMLGVICRSELTECATSEKTIKYVALDVHSEKDKTLARYDIGSRNTDKRISVQFPTQKDRRSRVWLR